jgi:hypothetical protein
MVTQNSHHAIGLIVRVEFLLWGCVLKILAVELFLKSYRGIVGTEDFGS